MRIINQQIIKSLNFIFVVLFFALGAASLSPAKAATVDGAFIMQVPNGGTLIQGCTYGADIRVNTGTNVSNAADVIVLFDPAKIEIIDSNPSQNIPTIKQIRPGSAYEAYPSNGNRVDEVNGIIRLSGVSFGNNLSGNEIFATIQFRSRPGATDGAFTIRFDGQGNTLDSNIAEYLTSTDILASKTDASMTFSSGSCVADTVPPNINFGSPRNNQGGVGLNQNITLNISDTLSGVNSSTIEIEVNGVTYSATSPQMTITGSPSNYTIIIDPTEPFYSNSPSAIVVKARDFAGNFRQSSIAFNFPPPPPTPTPSPPPAPDLIAPRIQFITPIANGRLSSNQTINFRVTDEGTGVDLNRLIVFVNDKRYTLSDSALTYSGEPLNYLISITDNFAFSATSSSYLSVFVADLASNQTSGNIIFNIPQNVIDEERPCPVSEPVTCGTNAPFAEQVSNIQDNIIDATPEVLRPLVEGAGFLGLASVVALLPLLIQILSIIGGVIAGGFLWPLILAIFLPGNRKLGKVIDDYTKEGISFVKIIVREKTTGTTVRKAYTDFSGRFGLKLDPGTYIFRLQKRDYTTVDIEAQINETKEIDFTFQMTLLESADISTNIQFNVFKFDLVLFTSILSTILAAVNLIYVRNLFAIIVFIIILVITLVLFVRKIAHKKPYSGQSRDATKY